MRKDQIRVYHRRYIKVMEDLSEISQMFPRVKYMYRLMDKVVFKDFETALDGVIEDFHASNDNENEEDEDEGDIYDDFEDDQV